MKSINANTFLVQFALVVLLSFWSIPLQAQTDPIQPKFEGAVVKEVESAIGIRENGQFNEAISQLRIIALQHPDYFRAQYQLGLAFAQDGKYVEASKAFVAAKEITKTTQIDKIAYASLQNSLGWTYYLMGDFKNSESNLKSALELLGTANPELNPKVLNNLGMLYYTKGDLDMAKRYFKESETRFGSAYAAQKLGSISRIQK